MKLFPAVCEFTTEQDGTRSVTLRNLDGSYKAVSYLVRGVGEEEDQIRLRVEPTMTEEEIANSPDEVQMLVAQSHMLLGMLQHYLVCDEHMGIVRAEIGIAHERLERSKAVSPHFTENTFESEAISIQRGIPTSLVVMLQMAREFLVTKPNEFENSVRKQSVIDPEAAKKRYEEAIQGHRLDFECVVPPLSDAERQLYVEAMAAQLKDQTEQAIDRLQSHRVH